MRCRSSNHVRVSGRTGRRHPDTGRVTDGAQDAVKDAGNAVENAADNVGDAVKDVIDGAGDVVKDAAEGAADGIRDMTGSR